MKSKLLWMMMTAVALTVVSNAALVKTHHWDFKGADQTEMLDDKAGGHRGDAPLTITGSGIMLNGDGSAVFAGFKNAAGDADSYAVADIANINNGVPHVVSFWYKADTSIQKPYSAIMSSNTSKHDGAVWQVDFLDRDADGDKDLRFISETAVGTQTIVIDPAADQWHHVAVVQRTGSNPQAQIWFDNAAGVQNNNWTGNVVRLVLGTNRARDVGFTGQIANVQIWELQPGDVNADFPETETFIDGLYTEGHGVIPEPATLILLGLGSLFGLK